MNRYESVRSRNRALSAVWNERDGQDKKWGEQNHPDVSGQGFHGAATYGRRADTWKLINSTRLRDGTLAWDGILLEEVYEALAESAPDKLRAELVQVAAVAVAWIEAIDRRVAEAEADLAASPRPGTGFVFRDSHNGKQIES